MKSAKREWALIAAYILFMIFSLSQHAFMTGYSVGADKMKQVHELATLGYLLGALLLSFLLPFQNLREGMNGGRLSHNALRLILVGVFFIPNIVFRLPGPEAWMESSFNSGFIAFANGVVVTLMTGCIFSLTGKYRVLWPALAVSVSLFMYHYALGPGRELLPYMFGLAGVALTLAGILILVFLAGLKPEGAKALGSAQAEDYTTNSEVLPNWGGGGSMAVSRACGFSHFLD
jgi:hypothetical protein